MHRPAVLHHYPLATQRRCSSSPPIRRANQNEAPGLTHQISPKSKNNVSRCQQDVGETQNTPPLMGGQDGTAFLEGSLAKLPKPKMLMCSTWGRDKQTDPQRPAGLWDQRKRLASPAGIHRGYLRRCYPQKLVLSGTGCIDLHTA